MNSLNFSYISKILESTFLVEYLTLISFSFVFIRTISKKNRSLIGGISYEETAIFLIAFISFFGIVLGIVKGALLVAPVVFISLSALYWKDYGIKDKVLFIELVIIIILYLATIIYFTPEVIDIQKTLVVCLMANTFTVLLISMVFDSEEKKSYYYIKISNSQDIKTVIEEDSKIKLNKDKWSFDESSNTFIIKKDKQTIYYNVCKKYIIKSVTTK